MAISVFDIFKIGIGPSSSHTTGPMRAARLFVERLHREQKLFATHRLEVHLYGSLAATGKGHATDRAILLGLMGQQPETINVDDIEPLLSSARQQQRLKLFAEHSLEYDENHFFYWHKSETLPFHTNGMKFLAFDSAQKNLAEDIYYSVGGGFVLHDSLLHNQQALKKQIPDPQVLPKPFHSAQALLALCQKDQCSIAEIMRTNERLWRNDADIDQGLLTLWGVMASAIDRGCRAEGLLPGKLKVPRRAAALHQKLIHAQADTDPLRIIDWVNLYALAVNEENAAGARVVTAPTNGASGIIPAVLKYYLTFVPHADESGIINFLLTAGAIGILFKENASISGAEVGCQGEVGVACSMAAGGLCAVSGGDPHQVENAAEVAMEHNLGLTCDPIAGLVQIPCIERNALAAVKAINACRLALHNEGHHQVSLDKVIATMKQTGRDMLAKYKETSLGGLAVNIIEC